MDSLKPCPCPACEGTHIRVNTDYAYGVGSACICGNCGMRGPGKYIEEIDYEDGGRAAIQQSKVDAVAAWNALPRRAQAGE
jgi:hypothetical protein